jgi:kelch-like protein 10
MTLFTTPLHSTEKTDAPLLGITSETISLVLEYAYMRRVDINQKNMFTLFESAAFLRMPGLFERCRDFIKSMLTPENCIGIMIYARDYSYSLEKEARGFVMRNFVRVSQQSVELLELPLEDLKVIIGADELNVTSEQVVWDVVLRWINHDEENRNGSIVELIKKVRLGLLDSKFVLENVKDHPYVAGNDECRAIIMDAQNSLLALEIIKQKEREIPYGKFACPRIRYETLFVVADCEMTGEYCYIKMHDRRTNRWVKLGQSNLQVNRILYGTAVIGFNVYVIGGLHISSDLNWCHCFNVVTKRWRELFPMQESRSSLSVAVLDELVYAMGGGVRGKTAERYDYRTNRWSMIAPMNEKRDSASATTLNGKIYVVGGENLNGCLNSAEVYDPNVNQWTSTTRMISARRYHSCIAYHGYVYAIGGTNGESCMSSGEKYNPTTNAWVKIPDLPQPRGVLTTAVLNDTIFAIGGFGDDDFLSVVECYDDKSNKWIAARDMDILASFLSAFIVMDL